MKNLNNKWPFYYALFILIMTFLLGLVPGHNGDMPYYIACAIEKEQGPQPDILQKTKQVLEKELPASEFIAHAKRINEAGKNILDFYRIKPLYIIFVAALHKIGFSYIFSTVFPSLLAYCCIGILTFIWAGKVLPPAQAFATSVALMLLNPAVVLARLSTPDALSNLVLLAAFCCIYFEKNKYITLFLLFFSIWIRMDNIIVVLIVLTGMRYWPSLSSGNRLDMRSYALLMLAAVGLVITMNYYYEVDFWWFTKTSSLYRWEQSWWQYGRQVLVYFLSLSGSFLAALIVFFAILQPILKFKPNEKEGHFLLILLAIFIVRLLLFPLFEERFATACYITAVIVLACRINRLKVPSG